MVISKNSKNNEKTILEKLFAQMVNVFLYILQTSEKLNELTK